MEKTGFLNQLGSTCASAGQLADLKHLQPAQGLTAFLDEYEYLIAPLIFTALSFFTRMWKIGLSDIVTWDEAQ